MSLTEGKHRRQLLLCSLVTASGDLPAVFGCTCWFLHASVRLWLLYECVHFQRSGSKCEMMFSLCHCRKNLKPLFFFFKWFSLQPYRSDTEADFGPGRKYVTFLLNAEYWPKTFMSHSARSCSLAHHTLNYLWDFVLFKFLRTVVQTLVYWPTFEVVHRWYMEQDFLESRTSSWVVGAMGVRSIAYLCVCTRSSLSPLKLCAAFVFPEEDINHWKSSTGINSPQKKSSEWIKNEEGWVEHSGRSSAERLCSVTKSRDSFLKWVPIRNPPCSIPKCMWVQTQDLCWIYMLQLKRLAGVEKTEQGRD